MSRFYKFKKSNIFKILVSLLAIYMCIACIASFIIASDVDHITHCTEEHCAHCAIIHLCQIQTKSIALLIPPSVMTLVFFIKHKFINSINEFKRKFNLIDYKIQLNI